MASVPELGWKDYEELTRTLVETFARVTGVQTTRLERNVELPGAATVNRIDVVWEFRNGSGAPFRVLFECRSYASRITQQALHSWRSVVDDSASSELTTVGVMVTTTGYQSGAQRVAETYGIIICELRAPTAKDLANRVSRVEITILPRFTRITDFNLVPTQMLSTSMTMSGPLSEFLIEHPDGTSVSVQELLLDGELSIAGDPPMPAHRVARAFDPPLVLKQIDSPIALVEEISATVEEVGSEPIAIVVGALERVAWMVADTINGSDVWFARDGKIWQTPS